VHGIRCLGFSVALGTGRPIGFAFRRRRPTAVFPQDSVLAAQELLLLQRRGSQANPAPCSALSFAYSTWRRPTPRGICAGQGRRLGCAEIVGAGMLFIRPSTGGRMAGVMVRMSADEFAALDAWRERQDGAPTRPIAIRQLVKRGLEGG
jgi:hypothetical protein